MSNNSKEPIVCMLVEKFPPYYGGAGKQVMSLSKELKRKGVKIFVIASNPNTKENNIDIIEGITVYRLGMKGSVLRRYSFLFKILKFLFSNRHAFNILHIHGLYPYSIAGLLISKLLRKKVIIKMTNLDGDDPITIKKRFLGNIQLRIFSSADRFISISSELSESFRKSNLGDYKLVEIVNGVDIEKFNIIKPNEKKLLRDQLGLPQDEIIACFVGVINERKGVNLLIEAWEKVISVINKAKLLLIGPKEKSDGASINESYIRSVYHKIKKNNLMKNIIFTGVVRDVVDYLKASDIFILPTRGEGLPNSLLEAMACGLPCIATRISCIEDIITDNENGFLFDKNDITRLSKLVIELAKDENIRKEVGKRARITIEKRFSLDMVSNKYIMLYNYILNEQSN